jgi:succinate dehydrogenase / fumarate reductase iron-sulfur subunit
LDVALKIWRFDADTGERQLRDYEVEAPEWACLLDVLDIVKDRLDGTLSFRKSCRMMICGSCGMRMDGRAVLACKEPMLPIVEAGHVPVISAMGNLPIVKDLVVDMGPFWQKMKAMKPWLQPGYMETPEGKEFHVSQHDADVIKKEALSSTAVAVSPSATRWSPTRSSSGPRRWPRACASSATCATRRR